MLCHCCTLVMFQAKYVNVDKFCCICGGRKSFTLNFQWVKIFWKCYYTCACRCSVSVAFEFFHKNFPTQFINKECSCTRIYTFQNIAMRTINEWLHCQSIYVNCLFWQSNLSNRFDRRCNGLMLGSHYTIRCRM